MSKYVMNDGLLLSPLERDILKAMRKVNGENLTKALRWLAEATQEGVA